jgi:hypothetical protein
MKLPAASRGYQSGTRRRSCELWRAKLRRSLSRLRSEELRRGSPCLHVGAKPKAKTDHPCSQLQGIQAKANKTFHGALKTLLVVCQGNLCLINRKILQLFDMIVLFGDDLLNIFQGIIIFDKRDQGLIKQDGIFFKF